MFAFYFETRGHYFENGSKICENYKGIMGKPQGPVQLYNMPSHILWHTVNTGQAPVGSTVAQLVTYQTSH